MRATLSDIARAAQVSTSTVSRALRGDPRVTATTRRRVESEAQRLGYPLAQGKAVGDRDFERSIPGIRRVALWMQTREVFQFFGETIVEVVEQGKVRGFEVEIELLQPDESIAARLHAAEASGVDAVMYATWHHLSEAEGALLRDAPLPIILLNRHVDGLTPSVTLDDFAAGFHAARYLVRLGHRRVAYLAGRPLSSSLRERSAGFRVGLERKGCYDPELLIERGDGGLFDWVQQSVGRLLSLPHRPTAIWAFNDMAASIALMTLRSAGLEVPKDISVMGFDRTKDLADAHITTFDVHFRELGRQAVYMLKGIAEGEVRAPVRWCVVPTLVEGATTGRAPELGDSREGEVARPERAFSGPKPAE